MIKPVTLYTVICDNCGKDNNAGQETIAWAERWNAEDVAVQSGWISDGPGGQSKHYCPDCYSYDDQDKLVLRNNKKINVPKDGFGTY